jgi:hypothetical protein
MDNQIRRHVCSTQGPAEAVADRLPRISPGSVSRFSSEDSSATVIQIDAFADQTVAARSLSFVSTLS